jgi:hypothetical protein
MLERPRIQFTSENKPLSNTLDINGSPTALWDDAALSGNILGRFDGPGDWRAIFPVNQSVPENGEETVHFMVSSYCEDRFRSIRDLTTEELSVPLNLAERFLNSDNRVVGFHNSEDDRLRKPNPQSWRNFHFHFYGAPYEMEELTIPPRKLKEPMNNIMQRLLNDYFALNYRDEDKYTIIPASQLQDFGYNPKGALLFRGITLRLDSKDIALAIKQIDSTYREMHRSLYSYLVTNYDEVEKSNWSIPYDKRLFEGAASKLNTMRIGIQDSRKDLLKFYSRLHSDFDENIVADHRIYRSPTYVVSIMNLGLFTYICFKPDFFRQAGIFDSLGLVPVRKVSENASLKGRRRRAETEVKKLGAY